MPYAAISPSNYSSIDDVISLSEDENQFMELVLIALGYDIKFEDFRKMPQEERKSLIRDIRINRILK